MKNIAAHSTKTARADNGRELVFDQYKIIVASAENVSVKRQEANKFHITAASALLATAGYFATLPLAAASLAVSLAGSLVSLSWLGTISSYRTLNKAKFKVIHEIENELPLHLFRREQQYLKTYGYRRLTALEKAIPVAFIALYAIIGFTALIRLFWAFRN